jgi:hypothetical protein
VQINKVYLGYWYQRTTLHLSETFDFLSSASSPLDFDKEKLKKLKAELEITEVKMKIGYFEYIEMKNTYGIKVKIYEDGLVVFEKDHMADIKEDIASLNSYFHEKFSPAMSYIFSLGAPLPKELANIKTISPFFITVENLSNDDLESLFRKLKEDKYYEIKTEGMALYRGKHTFVINPSPEFKNVNELVEMQIFFREFKAQLHRYLNMHRIIWEKIADIKEQGKIKGKNVGELRNRLEAYKKTIELIDGRIEQMGIHIKTRENIIKTLAWEKFLTGVLQFKYETLGDTLNYIKALWKMTKNYVDAAIQVFADIQSESTKDSVKTLTLVTTIGVISGILGYLSVNKFPQFTIIGAIYFVILLAATWTVNRIVSIYHKNRSYAIKDVELDKKIN